MPNYYNPYSFYPATYTPYMVPANINYPAATNPQQSYSSQPVIKVMEWVEGEVGAQAFRMPPGLPANQPIPLWDSTDTVIYLKSWGPMGVPNPMQKLKYEMPNLPPVVSANQSGDTQPAPQTANFATKDDLEKMKNEIRDMLRMNQNQNQNKNGNRGGQQNG